MVNDHVSPSLNSRPVRIFVPVTGTEPFASYVLVNLMMSSSVTGVIVLSTESLFPRSVTLNVTIYSVSSTVMPWASTLVSFTVYFQVPGAEKVIVPKLIAPGFPAPFLSVSTSAVSSAPVSGFPASGETLKENWPSVTASSFPLESTRVFLPLRVSRTGEIVFSIVKTAPSEVTVTVSASGATASSEPAFLTAVSTTRYSAGTSSVSSPAGSVAGTVSGKLLNSPVQSVSLVSSSVFPVVVSCHTSLISSRMVSDHSPPSILCCSLTVMVSPSWRSFPLDHTLLTLMSVPG